MAKTLEAALKFMDALVPGATPKQLTREKISRMSLTLRRAVSLSNLGTGTSTPNRCAKRSTILTRPRSSPTSN